MPSETYSIAAVFVAVLFGGGGRRLSHHCTSLSKRYVCNLLGCWLINHSYLLNVITRGGCC